MPKASWYFFLALETDLDATARYVEPAEANDGTYSIEFARILMAAAAEVEVVACALAREVSMLPSQPTINDLRVVFHKHYPKLPQMEISVPRAPRKLRPWSAWSGEGNPDWWSAHNRVKHDRHIAFEKATLAHALNAVAGLLCLQLYVHHELYNRGSLEPWCRLLSLEGHYETVVEGEGGILPDFQRLAT
jgi:hypothetical protein